LVFLLNSPICGLNFHCVRWSSYCSGIDVHSYGFNRNTPAELYNTPQQLLNLLIRCVSNGGNLLLDIGPDSDGSIPTIMQVSSHASNYVAHASSCKSKRYCSLALQSTLLSIGAWLNVNGEGVYNSQMWRVQQEGTIDNTTVRYTAGAPG